MRAFKLNIHTIICSILAVLMFIRMQPIYLWQYNDTLRPICTLLILVICLFNLSHDKWRVPVFLLSLLSYLWASVVVDRSELITVLNFSAFPFLLLLDRRTVYKVYKAFRLIFISFLILSIISFILVSAGFLTEGQSVTSLNSVKAYDYLKYPFLAVAADGEAIRFSGMFDEPGVIGTFSGMMLVAERMNLQRKGNWILLAGGFLSLSFYFFVAMAFGLVLFSNRLKHKWLYFIVAAVFFFGTYNNDFFYDKLWRRFEWNAETETLVGDNRNGGGLEEFYETFKSTPFIYTGLGSEVAERYSEASSLKLILVKHGLIFVVLNLSAFVLLALRENKNKLDLFFFLMFFVLTLYQRPSLYDTSSILLYVMTLYLFAANRLAPKKNGIRIRIK